MKTIRIGTRGSQLALYQAGLVEQHLKKTFPETTVQIQVIKTEGDERLDVSLDTFEGKGVFTKTLEDALLADKIDLAVHSVKDMAAELPKRLTLLAVLERENPQDCLISLNNTQLMDLKPNARIGTSSVRRKAQLKRLRPDIEIVDIRGNVDTRLKKMADGEYDGLIMAYAGIKRLNFHEQVTQMLDTEFFIPPCGQGAVGLEGREGNMDLLKVCSSINHEETEIRVDSERMFLYILEGGCQIPCGVLSEVNGNQFSIRAGIWAKDGSEEILGSRTGNKTEATELAKSLAEELISKGAKRLMG